MVQRYVCRLISKLKKMKTIPTPTEQSGEVVKDIVENVISQFEIQGDLNQLKVQIHPRISNAMYERDKTILERERFQTLIALARVLDDAAMESSINALGYELSVKNSGN